MMPQLKIKKQERLKASRQFQEIYIRGRRLSGPHLTIFFKPNQLTFNRLGLSVGKKSFRLSNRRHYIRRRLREAYRINKMRFLTGYDIIISVRPRQDFGRLSPELSSVARRAKEEALAKGDVRRFAHPLRAGAGVNKDKTRFVDIKNELLSLAQKARLLRAK